MCTKWRRNNNYKASLCQLFMYDFVIFNIDFVFVVQIIPMHCMRKFLS
jgi:hypothetical protein